MAIQYGATVNNARLDAIETTVGTGPTLELWSGTKPANCAAGDAGDGAKLADGVLPNDWMNDAAAASKTKLGTWTLTGLAAAGAGTAATHFRLKKTGTCHIQGTVTAAAGGGDMTLDNNSIANAQVVTVNTFTINAANT